MMEEEKENWRKVGKMSRKLLEFAEKKVKKGMPLIELTAAIEEKKPPECTFAFPINLSLNEIAAHFSPQELNRERAKGILKIDLGLCIDGFLGDTSTTIDLTSEKKFSSMLEANRLALKRAIELIKEKKEETKVREIGKIIEQTAKESGFNIIKNLTGHEIARWKLHTGKTIPNYDNGDEKKLGKGIFAIEPFFTKGEGLVKEGKKSGIYIIRNENAPVRNPNAKKLFELIKKKYKELPFSARWLSNFPNYKLYLELLEKSLALYQYPQLIEISHKPVSQFEHTILVDEKVEILTSIADE